MQQTDGAVITKKQYKSKPAYRNTTMVEIDITYPQVYIRNNAAASNYISGYYKLTAQKYFNYAARDMYKNAVQAYMEAKRHKYPFHTYNAMMVYEVTYNRNYFLSIYYDIYEFTGGAHGNTMRYADTWSTVNGKHMQLQDFFQNSSYKNIIFRSIIAQIGLQQSHGDNQYFDDYKKLVFQYFDDKNFYLTPDGFVIYYPLYTIAPYSSGIPVFLIPYKAFDGLLKYPLT